MKRSLTKRGARMLLILLISSLLAVFAGAGLVSAQPPDNPADPVRTLPYVVMQGDEFAVTVTFASPHDGFHAIALVDVAPAGWHVTVDTAWTSPTVMVSHAPTPVEAAYIWGDHYPAGTEFTAVYKVKVPPGATPGVHAFPGGYLLYYIDPHPTPPLIEPIGSDHHVEVEERPLMLPAAGWAYPVWTVLLASLMAGASLLLLRRRGRGQESA